MDGSRQLYDPVTGQHLVFMKMGSETGGELLQVEVRLDPRGRVPRHVHLRQDERIEVVTGALTARVGGESHQLGPGDSLEVHRRRLHVIRNAAEHETRFVLEVRPARHMELAMWGLFGVMRLLARVFRRTTRLEARFTLGGESPAELIDPSRRDPVGAGDPRIP